MSRPLSEVVERRRVAVERVRLEVDGTCLTALVDWIGTRISNAPRPVQVGFLGLLTGFYYGVRDRRHAEVERRYLPGATRAAAEAGKHGQH